MGSSLCSTPATGVVQVRACDRSEVHHWGPDMRLRLKWSRCGPAHQHRLDSNLSGKVSCQAARLCEISFQKANRPSCWHQLPRIILLPGAPRKITISPGSLLQRGEYRCLFRLPSFLPGWVYSRILLVARVRHLCPSWSH